MSSTSELGTELFSVWSSPLLSPGTLVSRFSPGDASVSTCPSLSLEAFPCSVQSSLLGLPPFFRAPSHLCLDSPICLTLSPTPPPTLLISQASFFPLGWLNAWVSAFVLLACHN